MNDKLRDELIYNQDTGLFTNKNTGIVYDKPRYDGYMTCKKYLVHRLAWWWVYNEIPCVIDHINGIKSDNRICNLRNVTHRENNRNQNVHRDGCPIGISFKREMRTNPYQCRSWFNKKRIALGYYKTIEEAKQIHDEFENLIKSNIIKTDEDVLLFKKSKELL